MRARDISAPIVGLVDRILAGRLRGLLPEEKRYWLLVPVTGLAAGLLGALFVDFLAWVEWVAWGVDWDSEERLRDVVSASEPARVSPTHRFLVPVVGGIVVAIALRFLRRDAPTEGTAGLLETLAVGHGRVPFLRNLLAAFTSLTAIGTGASLGREGALIQAGAGFGSWFGRTFHLREHHVKVLLACGAAGGMAAAYNAPIGASVFAMEVLLGSLALDVFGPIIIAAVVSTAVMHYFGADQVYTIPVGTLKTHVLVSEWEIPLNLLLGALIGVASAGFIRVFSGVHDLFRWLDPLRWSRPLAVMVILGLLGLAFPGIFSEIIGNGSDTVDEILSGRFHVDHPGSGATIARYLLLLIVLKVLATALCRAARIPGGLFTPSLFVGALLGLAFGQLVNTWFPGVTGPAEGYALVAMAAMVAGTMHAPITAVLMVFEMTMDYGLVLPLMTACIASAIVSRLTLRGSLFTEPLRRKGIHLPDTASPTWFKQPSVRSFLRENVATVGAATQFQQVMEAFLRSPKENDRIYVVNDDGKYLGVVSLHEIKTFFQEMEHLETVIAADIVNSYFPTVCVDAPMSTAVEILAESDAERLPVIDNETSRKLLGSVSKRDLLLSYRESSIARVTRNSS